MQFMDNKSKLKFNIELNYVVTLVQVLIANLCKWMDWERYFLFEWMNYLSLVENSCQNS
jgi:hypothetical protein